MSGRLFKSTTTTDRRSQLNSSEGSGLSREQVLKRRQRIDKFQKFAEVASHLPSRSGASAAKDFLVWIKANKKTLLSETGLKGATSDSVWVHLNRKVDQLFEATLGVKGGASLSQPGFEQLQMRLYHVAGDAYSQAQARKARQEGGQEHKGHEVVLPAMAMSRTRASTVQRQIGREWGTAGRGGIRERARSEMSVGELAEPARVTCHRILDSEGLGNQAARARVVDLQNVQWGELYDRKNDKDRIARAAQERQDKAEAATRVRNMRREFTEWETKRRREEYARSMVETAGESKDSDERIKARLKKIADEKREVGRAVKLLQKNLQATFTNTRNLPKDLFTAFCKCDEDMSGQIDYGEFKQVCKLVGLTALSEKDMGTLFRQCDRDGGGTVDFSEFFKVIVTNLVHV